MTPRQLRLVAALRQVSLPLGPRCDRRFIKSMEITAERDCNAAITPRQAAYLCRLVFRYRRQISTVIIEQALEEAEAVAELHPEALQPKAPTERALRQVAARVAADVGQLSLPFLPASAGGGSGGGTPETAREHLA